jgi:hypothetical protein
MWLRAFLRIVYVGALVIALEGVSTWLGSAGRAALYRTFLADYVEFADFYWHLLPSLSNPYTFFALAGLAVIVGAFAIAESEFIASVIAGYAGAQLVLAMTVAGYPTPSLKMILGGLAAVAVVAAAILWRRRGGSGGLWEFAYKRWS